MKRILYEEWHDDVVDARRRLRAERFADGTVVLEEQYYCDERWQWAGYMLQLPALVILALARAMQEAGWGGEDL